MNLYRPSCSRACLRSLLTVGIALALCGPVTVLAQQTAAVEFTIAAQPLDTALTRLADQGNVRILFVSTDVAGISSRGVSGRHTTEQALSGLLAGTPLNWRWREPGIIVVEPAGDRQAARSPEIVTDALTVSGVLAADASGAQRDVRGHDQVYDLDISTSYIGRVEVERYKGATPSDLLNGIPGVFSGDARNSGALDVNIRGIQGPGRVPVLIDGTEQGLTVWRGYNGATNRNYIDPFLIGGMQIIKGPAAVRNVNTGLGGAVVVTTLEVGDFLKEGQTFGGEFKLEGSSNSVSPRLPALHTGEDYRTVDGFPQDSPAVPYEDKTLQVTPKTRGGGYNVFNGEDHAYRMALGWRAADNLDLLAAYAYRERGNYYAGKHNAGYYSQTRSSSIDDYILSLATAWKPGNEVLNTSSQMESWLFKANWRPTEDQALAFGYRKSLTWYGEIMPSRIVSTMKGTVQWPLSRVDSQAYNLEYKWQPEGSRWIDLYANLWSTDTVSDTYTAGGFPNFAQGDPAWGLDPTIKNTALGNSTNTRNGVTLSNRVRFTDTLELTVGGNFQHEKLRSDDAYFGASDGWRMYPRAGRREEWNASFNFEWRPFDFLTLNAGMQYASYWAFDDFLKAHQGEIRGSTLTGYSTSYRTEKARPQSEIDADIEVLRLYEMLGIFTPAEVEGLIANIPTVVTTSHTLSSDYDWLPDANGNFSRATNPCLNGDLAGIENLAMCQLVAKRQTFTPVAKKQRDHGWVPNFSATVNFNDYSRAYFRYSEAIRFPSMFESTIGFSASLDAWGIKPEHAYNWEVAYVQDFSHLLSSDSKADIKLAYYSHKTRDVIERNNSFNFDNIDKQTIRGIELTGRYDNGRFFTDLGVNYNLENKVCDESSAVLLQSGNGGINYSSVHNVPNCMKYGFPNGYLLTQASPELSANWSLGGRFLQNRLEVGSRMTYFKQYKNPDFDWYRENTFLGTGTAGSPVYFANVPFSWGKTVLLDAYVNYRINERLAVELVGTNLTDQYYVDPVTRSAVAAPGRTLKLSLTATF